MNEHEWVEKKPSSIAQLGNRPGNRRDTQLMMMMMMMMMMMSLEVVQPVQGSKLSKTGQRLRKLKRWEHYFGKSVTLLVSTTSNMQHYNMQTQHINSKPCRSYDTYCILLLRVVHAFDQ
eukprot:1155754-Pelagomonas_calceolata.AAC.4